jgi:hypothetical protein
MLQGNLQLLTNGSREKWSNQYESRREKYPTGTKGSISVAVALIRHTLTCSGQPALIDQWEQEGKNQFTQ